MVIFMIFSWFFIASIYLLYDCFHIFIAEQHRADIISSFSGHFDEDVTDQPTPKTTTNLPNKAQTTGTPTYLDTNDRHTYLPIYGRTL